MTRPAWLVAFEGAWLAPDKHRTAARALLPHAKPSELVSPLVARSNVHKWEKRWLWEDASRRTLTARSYASRLRVALTEFAEDCDVCEPGGGR